MIFYLEKDLLPFSYVLVGYSAYNERNVVAGPKFFGTRYQAETWAKVFISSWQGSQLVVKL